MITQRHRHLRKGLKKVWAIHEAAAEDRLIFGELLKLRRNDAKDSSPVTLPFIVRGFVRAFFAEIEATSSAFAAALRDFHNQGVIELSLGEQVVLEEKRYTLGKGTVRAHPSYSPFLENLRFRYNLFLRAFGVDSALAVGDDGWRHFKQALHVRNSITHPSSPQDFDLSMEKSKALLQAIRWYGDQLGSMLDACHEVLEEPLAQSKR